MVILTHIWLCIDRYNRVSITWMQVQIASFSADNGLVLVLTTTPYVARRNGPEENQTILGA